MNMKFIGKKSWLKVSAAALLSIGVLAGCGNGEDDNEELDVNEPIEDVTPTDETDTDMDMDIETDDPDAEPGIDEDVDTEPDMDADVEPESELDDQVEEEDTK